VSDRVVLVTGAGRGIGRAIAMRFARKSARIIAASRTPGELDETRRLIESLGGNCEVQRTDVSNPEEVSALVESVVRRFERIDVLVNCAGMAVLSGIEELDSTRFEQMMDVNVRAVYHGCRAVWPVMKTHGGGVIISISSAASVDPFPGFGAYGASKAWVNVWTKALADEGRPFGIRVFAVAPGAVETQMLRAAFPDFPGDQTLAPEDVADVVYALAQPDYRHATGQTVFVKR
jgi:NAD(P)-dependent dehydrogenase (short-subunit alcohol dehydrogenase family)